MIKNHLIIEPNKFVKLEELVSWFPLITSCFSSSGIFQTQP